jgi:hypothetical protein
MFALALMAFVVTGVLGIVFVAPIASRRWDELSSNRWERKMLAGVAKIELEEELEKSKPSEAELAEATRELEEEMQDWV